MMTFTRESEMQFGALMDEMQKLTKREMPIVVRNVGRDFCRAAMKYTPLARRLTEADFQAGDGYVIRIKHRSTGKTVSFIGTKAEFMAATKAKGSSPGQYPQGRGYARIGWLLALIELGVTITLKIGKAPSVKAITETGDFVDGLKASSPFVEIANQVPYIEKLDRGGPGMNPHNIHARGMADTARKMEETLTKLSQKMAEKWNK